MSYTLNSTYEGLTNRLKVAISARSLSAYELLHALEGEIVDVNTALERPVNIRNRNQGERDQQREREDLPGMQPRALRAKHAAGGDGEHAAYQQHAPQYPGEPAGSLQQACAAMRREGAELAQGVVLGYHLGRGARVQGHQGRPHAVVDFEGRLRRVAGGHLRPVDTDGRVGIGARQGLHLAALRLRQAA